MCDDAMRGFSYISNCINDQASDKKKSSFALESWESAKAGKIIKGTFISLKGNQITITKENGKTLTFSLDLLSEKSQKRAQELSTLDGAS